MGRERSVRAGSSSRTVGHKKKKPYKVVLESITQKKKKLQIFDRWTQDSFEENAPSGYTFVPIGNVEVTEQCKEFCRKRGLKAYNVSTHPKSFARADPEKVSYHLNRVGFHFPSTIVDQAMNWIGIELNGRSRAGIANNLGRRLRRYGQQPERVAVITAMKDLFPKMPHESVDIIVEHAFEQGAKRVGNATNLSIERRVQMAVLAHVRHQHTDYDRLLKEVGYIEARKRVERPCIEKILEWRGEANDDDEEMEDDFREIIVLDDDDDDDSEVEDSGSGSSTPSIELVANEATADDLGPRDPGLPLLAMRKKDSQGLLSSPPLRNHDWASEASMIEATSGSFPSTLRNERLHMHGVMMHTGRTLARLPELIKSIETGMIQCLTIAAMNRTHSVLEQAHTLAH
ncbi:hypothetical protein HDK64DRAFT_307461 [Phyllosticta capitalensis]